MKTLYRIVKLTMGEDYTNLGLVVPYLIKYNKDIKLLIKHSMYMVDVKAKTLARAHQLWDGRWQLPYSEREGERNNENYV